MCVSERGIHVSEVDSIHVCIMELVEAYSCLAQSLCKCA